MGLSASQARMLSLTSRMSDLELRAQVISNAKVRLSDQSSAVAKSYSDALDKQILKVYTGTSSSGASTYADATFKNITTYGTLTSSDKFRYLETTGGKIVLTQQIAQLLGVSGADRSIVCNLDTFLKNCQKAGLIVDTAKTDASDVIYYTKLWQEVTQNKKANSDGNYNGNYTTADGDNPTSTNNENSSTWLQDQINSGNLVLYEWDNKAGTSGTGDYINTSWTTGDSTLIEDSENNSTAKAEATYDSQMASIESKDKKFDTELNAINTEHSSIQTEIESVKKIIQKNIERSLKVFDA